MFTTGSKLFIGLTAAAVVGLLLYGITQDWGSLGSVGLAFAVGVLGIFAGIALYTRDSEVDANAADAAQCLANDPAPGSSMWPAVGAFGLGITAIGLVTEQRVFVVGLAVIVIAFVEWLVQAWSERASNDPAYNTAVRKRIMNPIEFPVLGLLVAGVVIFFFSRMMLALSKSAGAVLFIVVAAIILLFGFIFAAKPKATTGVIAGIVTLGTLGLVAGGLAGAVQGEREELVLAEAEGHYVIKKCGPERAKYFDKEALRHVSMKTGAFATVTLENGRLTADVYGIGEADYITLQRSNPSDIIFVNRDPGEFRLTADLGTEVRRDDLGNPIEGPDGEPLLSPVEDCTQLMGQDNFSMLTLTIPKPSAASGPYRLFVPGVDGAEIEIVVP